MHYNFTSVVLSFGLGVIATITVLLADSLRLSPLPPEMEIFYLFRD